MSDSQANDIRICKEAITAFLSVFKQMQDNLQVGGLAVMFVALKHYDIPTHSELATAAAELQAACQRLETVMRRTSEIIEAKFEQHAEES